MKRYLCIYPIQTVPSLLVIYAYFIDKLPAEVGKGFRSFGRTSYISLYRDKNF